MKWVCYSIHTTQPPEEVKWPSAISRLAALYICGLMSGLVICKDRKEYGHTWHWMSYLRPGVIKQHKLLTSLWGFKHIVLFRSICIKQIHILQWLDQLHTITLRVKATIHQVTTMLVTYRNVLFPGHNHLLTTGTDDPSLAGAWVIISISSHQHQWLAGGYDLEIGHFWKWLAWWFPSG